MLENVDNIQQFADILKKAVLDADATAVARLEALDTISRFERCGWHSIAMTESIQKFQPSFTIIDSKVEITSSHSQFLQSIEEIYHEYSQHIDCDPFNDILTMREAAEFLGISYSMMKTYVSREKRIRGKIVGTSTVFTRHQLEEFRDNEMRPPGRPPASDSEE